MKSEIEIQIFIMSLCTEEVDNMIIKIAKVLEDVPKNYL